MEVRLRRGAWRHAEEPGFGVDGVQPSVGADLHPRDVVADTLAFPPRDGRDQHGQVGLAAGGGEGRGDMEMFSLRVGQAQDEHVLGQPSLPLGLGRRDAQGQAFLAQQGVAAVSGSVRPDEVFLGEVRDIFLVQGGAGPGLVGLPGGKGIPDGMQARDELAVLTQSFQDLVAHARHDVHIHHHVRRVGDFHADFGGSGKPMDPWRRG